MNKRGVVLIICYMVIMVLSILGAALFMRSVSETSVTNKYFDSAQAFWLAEAGISRALKDFKTGGSFVGVTSPNLGPGGYTITVDSANKIRSRGFIPFVAPYQAERTIELNIRFYNAAIYGAGNIDIAGDAYSITGDVVYAGTGPAPSPGSPDNIVGEVTHDPAINPLDLLNFADLRIISQNQGNLNDPDRPTSYWFNETLGIPNVVYLDGDLTLHGNDSVHGFFVVGGAAIADATLSGTVEVDGCIYTRGDFRVNGGGGGLNINGAVWVGENTDLHGTVDIRYNEVFVTALRNLGINRGYKIIWRETQTPF